MKQKPFKALYSIMCGRTHRIVTWKMVTSVGHVGIRPTWQELAERHKRLGVAPPKVVVLDNCCTDRAVINSVFPTTQVTVDVWHVMDRILKTLTRSHHIQYRIFAKSLSSRIYKDLLYKVKKIPLVYW